MAEETDPKSEIHVPELEESVTEATVGKWLKAEGDQVKAGEPLVELETDKINFEVEAEQDGVLESIAKGEGEDVGVGELLAIIAEGDVAAPTIELLSREVEPEQAQAERALEEEVKSLKQMVTELSKALKEPEPKSDEAATSTQRTDKLRRVNVNFSGEAYAMLKQLADEKQTTISEVVRDAIALEKWYQDTVKKEGGRILVDRGGKLSEVIMRR